MSSSSLARFRANREDANQNVERKLAWLEQEHERLGQAHSKLIELLEERLTGMEGRIAELENPLGPRRIDATLLMRPPAADA